jgi:hypothetical protein
MFPGAAQHVASGPSSRTPHPTSMDLDTLAARSRVTAEFMADLRAFAGGADRTETPRIAADRRSPRIKVLRILTHLLASAPEIAIERVSFDARSGCSDYRGVITVESVSETRTFDFVWCCAWRATQEGWFDCFGFPDQIRAAREFGWQCMERWEERVAAEPAPFAPAASGAIEPDELHEPAAV